MIYDIGPETQAATGLQPGDVIFQVNRQRVRDADDLRRAFRSAEGGGAVTVWFERRRMIGRSSFYVR